MGTWKDFKVGVDKTIICENLGGKCLLIYVKHVCEYVKFI